METSNSWNYFQTQFDWICIDLEHSTIDLDSFKELVSLGEKYNKKTYARIPEINKSYVNKILDAGANGLIIANVSSNQILINVLIMLFIVQKDQGV